MSAAAIVFFVCAAACLVAHLFILRSVVRRPAPSGEATVPRPNLFVEIVWAVVPAIVLAFVLTATWSRIQTRAGTPPVIMRIAR